MKALRAMSYGIVGGRIWGTFGIALEMKMRKIPNKKYIKKLERTYTSSLTAHLEAQELKEANSPKRSRQQEIIKLMGKINQAETRRTIQRINQRGAGSLRKSRR